MNGATKIHEGRNVKRIREILGIKQDTLANDLGLSQQSISQIEQKEVIDDELMNRISAILHVPVEAIRNFDSEAAINIISNTFTSQDNSILNAINPYCTFNPIDKIVELFEKLVESEKEKVELLKKLLEK